MFSYEKIYALLPNLSSPRKTNSYTQWRRHGDYKRKWKRR